MQLAYWYYSKESSANFPAALRLSHQFYAVCDLYFHLNINALKHFSTDMTDRASARECEPNEWIQSESGMQACLDVVAVELHEAKARTP